METKYCSKCKEWKSINEFYENNRGGCKKCIRKYQSKYYSEHYSKPRAIEILPDGLRRCSICKVVKDITEFYKDKTDKSGFHHRCKKCCNSLSNKRKKKQRAIIREATREILPDGMKRCRKCGDIYPLSEFRKTEKGYTSPCRNCRKKYKKDNHDRILSKNREYKQKTEIKEKINKSRRERRVTDQDYRAKEREFAREYNQRDYVKAKAKIKNAVYRSDVINQIKARQKTIEWRKTHPEQVRLQAKTKRARKKGAEGRFTVEQWEELLKLCDYKCLGCGSTKKLTRDHIVPLSKNGTNYIDNIQPLCHLCNTKKRELHSTDYRPPHIRQWAAAQVSAIGC